jgi:pimeloyl-ACP methyl ester carboxylesterase
LSAFSFLNRLENIGVPVKAMAVASGPVDLYATVNRWANAWEPIDAVYIPPLQSNMIYAFEAYYGLPGLANSAIKPEYQATALQLFRNEITYEEAAPLLPTRLPDLLQEEFKAAVAAGQNRFSQLLQDSHAYRWRMATPSRVYYGGRDEVTPIFIGTLPVGYQQVMGGAAVTAVDAGKNADHRGVFLYGMQDQKGWFDELLVAG